MASEFNFSELVANVTATTGENKTTVNAIIFSAFQAMAAQLGQRDDGRIEIADFGVLKLKLTKERRGKTSGKIGPVTEWVKPAYYAVKFKPGPDFIDMINQYFPPDAPVKAGR